MDKIQNVSLLPYIMLALSFLAIYLNLYITPFVIVAFIITSVFFIDKRSQEATEQDSMAMKKRLDIYLRMILSGILILIITHEFFFNLSTEAVLYVLLFIPLTTLLILNSK